MAEWENHGPCRDWCATCQCVVLSPRLRPILDKPITLSSDAEYSRTCPTCETPISDWGDQECQS